MRKEDLKEGMVIITESDSKIVIDNKMYFCLGRKMSFPIECVFAGDDFCPDVIKVEYQGEVVWNRENKYTLAEAIAKNTLFKHKDCERYYYNLTFVLDDLKGLHDYDETREMNEYILSQINSRVWEVAE